MGSEAVTNNLRGSVHSIFGIKPREEWREHAAVDTNVEALKTLTLALLKEVESLGAKGQLLPKTELSLNREVRRFEANLIRSALICTGGRQRRAARLLGVKPSTLNAKIKRYNLDCLPISVDRMRHDV